MPRPHGPQGSQQGVLQQGELQQGVQQLLQQGLQQPRSLGNSG